MQFTEGQVLSQGVKAAFRNSGPYFYGCQSKASVTRQAIIPAADWTDFSVGQTMRDHLRIAETQGQDF
jgi:hypothetical protein